MNRNNKESLLHRTKAKIGHLALVGSTALATFPAFAGGGPDTSSITTELGTYKTAVIALVIAFCVVLWAIKGAGLLKPR